MGKWRTSALLAAVWRGTTAATAIAAGTVGFAAQAQSPAASTFEFNIPEQPLDAALRDLARQTGKQVVIYADEAVTLQSAPLRGRFTEGEALTRLLGGTGLSYEAVDARTIAVGRRDAQGRLAGAPPSGGSAAVASQVDNAGEVILVTGRLRDAELSTDAKRNSDQIEDVITADQASQLPDKNVAETLARIPGVSVVRNGETGDGAYISIRGLDSALSNIQFNGVNSGQANGSNRSIPLEGITADNVREIRVAKSLLPADEGTGIGGAVNIITRTPLQGGRNQITFDGSLRYGEFSGKTGFDGAVSLTRIFSDSFGINLAASFRRRFIQTYNIDASNSYLAYIDSVTNAQGQTLTATQLNALGLNSPNDWRNYTPGEFEPEQIDYEQQSYQILEQTRDTLSLSGAIDWRPSDTTIITLSGRYSANKTNGVEWMLGFDEDGGNMSLVGDRLVATWLDLELDYEAQNEQSKDRNATALLKGETETDRFTLTWQASYANAQSENPQTDIVFSSANRFDRGRTPPLTYHPYTFADTYFPVPNASLVNDPGFRAATSDIPGNVELTGWRSYEITQKNDRYAGRADLTYNLDASFLGGVIDNVTIGGKVERSDRYTFFDYYQATATRLNVDGTFNGPTAGTALGKTLSQFTSLNLGSIDFEPIGSPLSAIGIDSIPTFDRTSWNDFTNRFRETFIAADYPYFSRDFFDSREDVYAGYGQFDFELGSFKLIAGARVERYEGRFATPISFNGTVRLVADGQADRELELQTPGTVLDTVTTSSSNVEIMPRLAATWDLTDSVKVRFGAGQSIARPTYSQLGNAASVNISLAAEDPAGGVILPGVTDTAGAVAAGGLREDQISDVAISVSSGNPDLDNARSTNIDLSLEWYPQRGTAITLGLFYKTIDNFIFLGSESSDGTLDVAFVESLLSPAGAQLLNSVGGVSNLASDQFNPTLTVSRPVNGGTATLKGAELGVNHRFDWMLGPLRHLGFYGNVTYTDSNAEFVVQDALDADEALVVLGFYQPGDTLTRRSAFYRAPEISGAASLFYDDGKLDWALSGTYQSASFDATDDFGLDQYTASYKQLDFFLGYALPVASGEVKVFFEVADLLDNGTKPTDVQTVGKRRVSWDESSFNGREFRFGVRTRF